MNLTEQIAKHFREVHFGGNWTSVNLKESLADVDWQKATTQVYSFNTIATLVYHINYYVSAVLKVLQGEALDASDKYSFDLPPILSLEEWENCWIKPGLMQKILQLKLNNYRRINFGKYLRMKNMEPTTEISTELLNIFIII